ncbi:hypothetical protein KC324_g235 [Hortaea werneckii]|nr:hypothetical protein KC324_g235 [Hortaea werneckii]
MSWRNNTADRIEKQLQRDGHRTWGFVIYRTTYESDDDWKEFLRRLRLQTKDHIGWHCNGADILELESCTIMEGRDLDGADSHEVRRRFLAWRSDAVDAEQRVESDGDSAPPKTPGFSPRYRFAIQVDRESLLTVVHNAPPPEELPHSADPSKRGWVRLIDAEWQHGAAESLRADLGGGLVLSGPMAMSSPADHGEHEAIEGVTTLSVGWMKIPYETAQTETYANAGDPNWWVREYCRPPMVLEG